MLWLYLFVLGTAQNSIGQAFRYKHSNDLGLGTNQHGRPMAGYSLLKGKKTAIRSLHQPTWETHDWLIAPCNVSHIPMMVHTGPMGSGFSLGRGGFSVVSAFCSCRVG